MVSVPTSFARGGLTYAGLTVVAAVPATLVTPVLGLPLLAAAVGVLYFYRDPERRPPAGGLLAPADGTVTDVEWVDGRVRVSTYLGLRDVHVVRSPVGGRVRGVDRSPGGHWPALSKRSARNERVTVRYDGLEVTMIAGALARRIRPYVAGGQRVGRGDRLGHIAFGSRTDVLLPEGVGPADLAVEPGEAVRAGETVLVAADDFDRREAAGAAADDDGPGAADTGTADGVQGD
jgi:phosphatidylserine decarboxylase